jgi:glycosyltransferase involved in cell wall biosynthesis
MIWLGYLVLGFTAVQLLVALVNLIFREKPEKGTIQGTQHVSVLIPARNEENNISNILSDLLSQDYRNIEIIVFNDLSEDRTAGIVREFSKKDPRIRLINSEGLPPGWTGKNFACFSLSEAASGEYLLFIDADVRISGGIIPDMISMAEKHRLSLISIFPKQIIETPGEKITVPNMNYILLTLLPLVLVRKLNFPSLSAANGQFMFFRKSLYREMQPHGKLKDEKVEDIMISRLYKRNSLRVACLTGNDSVRCRMYSGLDEAVNGFSKNIGAFFGNSLLMAFLFWLITTLGFIPVMLSAPFYMFAIYLSAYFMTRVLVAAASEQNPAENLLSCIPQQVTLGMFIYKALNSRYSDGFEWKGRKVK